MFQLALGPLLLLSQHVTPASWTRGAEPPRAPFGGDCPSDCISRRVDGGQSPMSVARGSWLEAVGVGSRQPIMHLSECIEVVRHLLSGREDGYPGRV